MPKPESDNPYRPIDCNVYDELLVRATRRRPVVVVYRRDGAEVTCTDTVEDVFTEGEAEYARLGSGTVVRLDRLVSVDGVQVRPDQGR